MVDNDMNLNYLYAKVKAIHFGHSFPIDYSHTTSYAVNNFWINLYFTNKHGNSKTDREKLFTGQ